LDRIVPEGSGRVRQGSVRQERVGTDRRGRSGRGGDEIEVERQVRTGRERIGPDGEESQGTAGLDRVGPAGAGRDRIVMAGMV
jgi:hypothetical protein